MSYQVEMVNLEELVSSTHQYRQFSKVFDFSEIEKSLNSIEKEAAYKGYGIARLFKCLVLQFMEDISDRELERYIQENNAAKWFCDFGRGSGRFQIWRLLRRGRSLVSSRRFLPITPDFPCSLLALAL